MDIFVIVSKKWIILGKGNVKGKEQGMKGRNIQLEMKVQKRIAGHEGVALGCGVDCHLLDGRVGALGDVGGVGLSVVVDGDNRDTAECCLDGPGSVRRDED